MWGILSVIARRRATNCAVEFYVNVTQANVSLEGRTLIEKMLPLDEPLSKPKEHLLD